MNNKIEQLIIEVLETQRRTEILLRVNNLLLSKFILQLSQVRNDLHLPKRKSFFKFELLEEDYNKLAEEFGNKEVDKALYRLDRMLLQNKLNCPHNIKKFIARKLKRTQREGVQKDE